MGSSWDCSQTVTSERSASGRVHYFLLTFKRRVSPLRSDTRNLQLKRIIQFLESSELLHRRQSTSEMGRTTSWRVPRLLGSDQLCSCRALSLRTASASPQRSSLSSGQRILLLILSKSYPTYSNENFGENRRYRVQHRYHGYWHLKA